MSSTGKRIDYVDFYRFIGITLMIIGHVGVGSTYEKIVHAFNMPMFFLVSGYCFGNGTDFRNFIKNKSKRLIIPYFAFSLFTFLMLRRINGIGVSRMTHVLWINNVDTPIAGVWFITALFFGNLLFFFINKINNSWIKWSLSFFLFLLGLSLERDFSLQLPWSLNAAFASVLFICIGKEFRREEQKDSAAAEVPRGGGKNLLPIWSLALFALAIGLAYANRMVNMRTNTYDNIALFFFVATVVSLLLLRYCRIFDRIVADSPYNAVKKLYGIFCSIGRYSICYLCSNQVAIRYSRKLAEALHVQNKVATAAFVLVCSFLAMYVLHNVIVKTKLRVIIGEF